MIFTLLYRILYIIVLNVFFYWTSSFKHIFSSLLLFFQAALCLLGVALSAPAPEDAAAPLLLPYGYGLGAYPYALPHAGLAYAGLPLAYHPLSTGLVYPVAEAYVHDPAGDVSDDSSPEAVAYVHDTTGDVV